MAIEIYGKNNEGTVLGKSYPRGRKHTQTFLCFELTSVPSFALNEQLYFFLWIWINICKLILISGKGICFHCMNIHFCKEAALCVNWLFNRRFWNCSILSQSAHFLARIWGSGWQNHYHTCIDQSSPYVIEYSQFWCNFSDINLFLCWPEKLQGNSIQNWNYVGNQFLDFQNWLP